MFCPRCGLQLPDDALFCESCGLQVQQTAPRQQVPAQAQPISGPSKRWPIVLALVSVLVIAGIIIGTMLSDRDDDGVSLLNQNVQTTPAATSQGQNPQDGTASDPQNGGSTQQVASSLVDLGNAKDYHDLNLFLSNFVEWPEFVMRDNDFTGWGNSFERDSYNIDQLANWTMWHYAINNEGVMDNGGTVPGATQGVGIEIEGVGKDLYPRSVDRGKMEEMAKRYMGIDVDFSQLHGRYESYGGRVYEGSYRGDARPLNTVALADRVETTGSSTIVVQFTTYQCGYSAKVIEDKSWYGYTPDELIAAMRSAYGGSNTITRRGVATVEVTGSGNDREFKLVQISTTA